jgi:hypothetical protein
MVCGISSVLKMFLLLNKPVVTYQNISPGNFLIDIDSAHLLESSIERALSPPDEKWLRATQKTQNLLT